MTAISKNLEIRPGDQIKKVLGDAKEAARKAIYQTSTFNVLHLDFLINQDTFSFNIIL